MVCAPQIVYERGVVVAKTLRVLLAYTRGKRWQETSEKEKAETLEK